MTQDDGSGRSGGKATMTGSMRAVIGEALGPIEGYRLATVALPEPGAGDVRVRVDHASLGHADALLALGRYQVRPPLPFTPGTEVAGTVEAIGAGVTGLALGMRVTAGGFGGGLAEAMIASAGSVRPIPRGLGSAEAACFRSNFQTALHALADRGGIATGETLLVLGAGGGVGIAAVQLGHALGARVIAGASTPERRAFARANGADDAIDYTLDDWRAALRESTAGRGVDVVFDPVGGALFEPAFRSLAWRGRHLVIGFAGGAIPKLPANLPLLKGAALVGVDIRQFTLNEPQAAAANDARLTELVEAGSIRPPAGPVFGLEDYRAALAAAGSNSGIGKVVVAMRGRPSSGT